MASKGGLSSLGAQRDQQNRSLNDRYQQHLRDALGADRTFFAGRLADYLYIDMDDCMRSALDSAERVSRYLQVAA